MPLIITLVNDNDLLSVLDIFERQSLLYLSSKPQKLMINDFYREKRITRWNLNIFYIYYLSWPFLEGGAINFGKLQ